MALAAAKIAAAQVPAADGPRAFSPYDEPTPQPDRTHATPAPKETEKKSYREWLVALEGVTHAPVDIGLQAGVQAPFGLRLFGGHGWMPPGYIGILTGTASRASGDERVRSVLDAATFEGDTWRIQTGYCLPSVGLYLDVGYSRVNVSGSLDLSNSPLPVLAALDGGYDASWTVDTWLVELGYQGEIANRFVLAFAIGAMRAFDAQTVVTARDGAPTHPALRDAARQVDRSIETYGIVPTLTVRAGFDLI